MALSILPTALLSMVRAVLVVYEFNGLSVVWVGLLDQGPGQKFRCERPVAFFAGGRPLEPLPARDSSDYVPSGPWHFLAGYGSAHRLVDSFKGEGDDGTCSTTRVSGATGTKTGLPKTAVLPLHSHCPRLSRRKSMIATVQLEYLNAEMA
jgi:hypothetical protein